MWDLQYVIDLYKYGRRWNKNSNHLGSNVDCDIKMSVLSSVCQTYTPGAGLSAVTTARYNVTFSGVPTRLACS